MEREILDKFEQLITENISKQSTIECLEDELNKKTKCIRDLEKHIEVLKRKILELSIDDYEFKYNPEEVCDFGSYSFGLRNKVGLLDLGFTKEELISFVEAHLKEVEAEEEEE